MLFICAMLFTSSIASSPVCPFNGTHDEIASAAAVALAYNDTDMGILCLKKAAGRTLQTLGALVSVLKQENRTEAAMTISAAIEVIGGDGDAIMYHAKALLDAGQSDAARSRFEQLVQNNPNHAQLNQYLALAQWNTLNLGH